MILEMDGKLGGTELGFLAIYTVSGQASFI